MAASVNKAHGVSEFVFVIRAVAKYVEARAAWPSGLERWCCNPEVPGSRPPPCHQRDLFLGSPELKSSVTLCK